MNDGKEILNVFLLKIKMYSDSNCNLYSHIKLLSPESASLQRQHDLLVG